MHEKAILAFDDRYEIRINWFSAAENNHIFNEAAFFQLHATSANDIYAQLARISDDKIFATIAFYDVGNDAFSSPKRGTFGGIGLNLPLEMQQIEKFLASVVQHLEALGAKAFEIKLPPLSHDLPQSSILANILIRNEWALSANELNYDMRVDVRPFLSRVDYGNAKRIRKCQRDGFVVEKLQLRDLAKVHAIISENRARRGHPISMTLSQLEAMATQFPSRTHIFGVSHGEQRSDLIAASVCLALTPSIFYVFYWGDLAGMESYSPIALLASGVYNFCQRESFSILDAGTSTLAGKPNYGLIKFKQGLGFSASLKASFSRFL